VFGEYRAPTGVGDIPTSAHVAEVRERIALVTKGRGPLRMVIGKPGLDGHSNGAEQIAVAARDAGFEVIYPGIRLTPEAIAAAARDEDVDIIGLSLLSGSHRTLVPETLHALQALGVQAPVVVGGIIPEADWPALLDAGVVRIYTPKNYQVSEIISDLATLALDYRSCRP
jgi:(2R)-ethylmalonyl-CoA mutase